MKRFVLLVLVVSTRVAVAGECPSAPLVARPLTADGTEIAVDGGIVVVYERQAADEPKRGVVKDWRFVDGKQRTAPAVKTLAPGVEVLQPAGTLLQDANGGKLLGFSRAKTATSVLDAPSVSAVVRNASAAGRRIVETLVVQLQTTAPADRLLVVFDQAGKVARSWGHGTGSTKTVAVFSKGDCALVAEGTADSQVGDEVRLAWVDMSGRLSKLSPEVKVTTTTPVGPTR
jgi:hypothetical protein